MITLQVVCCFLLVAWCWAQPLPLQLNPNATILKDLKSILHDKSFRQVIVEMHSNRSCSEPSFLVRLSGSSLYVLDQSRHESSHNQKFTFTYPPLIDVGKYFLEVIVFYCKRVDPNNYATQQCMISPAEGRNVLTLPYSFDISADEVVHDHRARWVLKPSITPTFLPTRYQKNGCSKEESMNDYCIPKAIDVVQYSTYEWKDKPDHLALLKKVLQLTIKNDSSQTGLEKISFCLLGASHSRTMWAYANKLGIPKIQFEHIDYRFPFQVDPDALQDCSYAIMGFGQWPMSFWMENHPYTARQYYDEMHEVLTKIKRARPLTQVFTRSMNYNGLVWGQFVCPANDFRMYPAVNIFNEVMRNVTHELGFEFIDTTHIQGPMWDGAQDYSHCSEDVFVAEAEYIMHHAFAHSLHHHRMPTLDPGMGLRDLSRRNTLVRFSDNDTIYMKVGELRAFPSNLTFKRLGYKPNEVHVIDANLRKDAHIGAPFDCLPRSRCD